MNREIKFRAWLDKKDRFDEYCDWGMFTGWKFEDIYSGSDEAYITCEDKMLVEPNWDKLKVMRYTGLKDKNGKEIYEGDILQSRTKYTFKKDKNKSDRLEDSVVVYFGEYDNKQGYEEQENGIGFYIKNIGWGDFTIQSLDNYIGRNTFKQYGMENTVEVIGNIWENPELVEG